LATDWNEINQCSIHSALPNISLTSTGQQLTTHWMENSCLWNYHSTPKCYICGWSL